MQIIYTLLAIYALVFFTCTVIIFTPCYFLLFLLSDPLKAPFRAHRLSRTWASLVIAGLLVRVKIKGKEKLDPNATYVCIANHLSQLDVPVYAMACLPAIRFLAKAELGKIPLMGYVIRRTYFMVDRSNKSDRSKSMAAMQKSLGEGIGLFLCPEGTRNRTGEPLLPFKDGAFRLAIEAQVPLAALVIYNSHRRNSPRIPLSLIPGTIEGEWIEVIDTKGLTEKNTEELKDRVRKNMENHIIAWRKEHGR